MNSLIPPGWGQDPITQYMDQARDNAYASYVHMTAEYSNIVKVDKLLRTAQENLVNTNQLFPSFFLLRSHSCYLAGVSLALSGQTYESYPVLRNCLESSVYGFHIYKSPDSLRVWADREKDAAARRQAKREFKVSVLIKEMSDHDTQLGDIVTQLYDRMIDLGGHPNVLGMSANWEILSDNDKTTFNTRYLTGDELPIRLAMRTCAQAGYLSLSIFRNVYRERFDIVGISDRLRELRGHL